MGLFCTSGLECECAGQCSQTGQQKSILYLPCKDTDQISRGRRATIKPRSNPHTPATRTRNALLSQACLSRFHSSPSFVLLSLYSLSCSPPSNPHFFSPFPSHTRFQPLLSFLCFFLQPLFYPLTLGPPLSSLVPRLLSHSVLLLPFPFKLFLYLSHSLSLYNTTDLGPSLSHLLSCSLLFYFSSLEGSHNLHSPLDLAHSQLVLPLPLRSFLALLLPSSRVTLPLTLSYSHICFSSFLLFLSRVLSFLSPSPSPIPQSHSPSLFQFLSHTPSLLHSCLLSHGSFLTFLSFFCQSSSLFSLSLLQLHSHSLSVSF